MKIIFSILLVFISFHSYSQDGDVQFTINTIESNYPPLSSRAAKESFEKYCNQLLSSNKDRDEFWKLSKIVNHFHDRHLVICDTTFLQGINEIDISRRYKEIIQYLSRRLNVDYEGYWLNDHASCIIGIRKTSDNPLIYKGYVIESRNPNLKPGMVCCSFEQEQGDTFNTNYISTVDRYRVYARSYFCNDSTIITGSFDKWKKLNDYTPGYLRIVPLYSRSAEFRKLNDNSFLIRIPEDSHKNVAIVDSLTKLYKDEIEKSKTLIIDVRNNDGGTVRTYYPLLPFIYTNPIKTVNASLYCSPGGTKDYEQSYNDYMTSPKVDSNVAAIYRKTLEEMKAKPGKFILYPGKTIKYDSIKEYPKNVAIITNYGTLSAAELMLLDFRQSKKVKLFGENSGGAVDHLDYYHVMSPSKKYWLYIPNTKRMITEEQPKYDGKGIPPDVKITDATKDWVKFVQDYYNTNQ